MKLSEAIAEFRRITEATTSSSIATRTTDGRFPFFGKAGLAAIERERQARMKRAKKKCKGYDPECRDKEWEVPARTGGVALLRRSRVGER